MKKTISLLLSVLLILSAGAAFAAERPENLAVWSESTAVENKVTLESSTCDIKGATVTVDGDAHPAFGDGNALVDGVGMADGVNIYAGTLITDYTSIADSNRWMANDGNVLPKFTLDFGKDITFNTVQFTEVRNLITGYKIIWYNDGVVGGLVEETINTTPSSANYLYLYEKNLGKTVVADKVVFEVTSRTTAITSGVSMTEIGFMSKYSVSANTTHPSFGSASAMFDGVGMAVTSCENKNRWTTENGTVEPVIKVNFGKTANVSAIRFTEYRKEIKEYIITCYSDGKQVLEKKESFTDTTPSQYYYVRTIDLGQSVAADSIQMKFTHASTNVISIAEMEFIDRPSAPSIVDADGNAIPVFDGKVIANAFDGKYDATPADGKTTNRYQFLAYDSANANAIAVKTPITIQFDLGTAKTFNYAELSEFRCMFGEIDVYYYGESGWTLAGTMPKMAYNGSINTEYIHSVSFAPVNARLVKYVIKEIAPYAELDAPQRTANISEISLCNYSGEDEVTIYPVQVFGKNITEFTYTYGAENTVTKYNSVNTNILINNTSETTKKYKLIAVHYNSSDEMNNVVIKNVTLNAGESCVENLMMLLHGTVENVANGKVSYMVWDMDTLTPYCGAVTIEK